jgi:hypothetical protein
MDFRKIEDALAAELSRLLTEVRRVEGALYALANVRSAVKEKQEKPGKRKTMSAAARRRISTAQKARWKKVKARKS